MINIFEERKVDHIPHSLPTTPEELNNLPESFKGTYLTIKNRWGYTARISSLLEMIQYSYGISEWELLEPKDVNNGEIQGEWMDTLKEYMAGKAIDFGKIWEDIKTTFDFSIRELNLIETGEIDKRLWAIYTVLTDQTLPITY